VKLSPTARFALIAGLLLGALIASLFTPRPVRVVRLHGVPAGIERSVDAPAHA